MPSKEVLELPKISRGKPYEYSLSLRQMLDTDSYVHSKALLDAVGAEKSSEKLGMSDERIEENLGEITKHISFWREYPDKFVDFLLPKDSKFNLFFYQRVFLRAAIRHKYTYATFPRAFSKSFLSILLLVLRCVLYPGAKLFIVAGTKEQNLLSI